MNKKTKNTASQCFFMDRLQNLMTYIILGQMSILYFCGEINLI